jgi:hypothetical protein
MKIQTTFILLGIALLFGLFILFLDRQFLTTREKGERAQRVINIQRQEIKGFTIRNGDDLIKVKIDGDSWKIVQPWTDSADLAVVDQLLNAIQFLRPDDVIENLGKGDTKRDKMKEFGLHRTRLSLHIDAKNASQEIQFGGDAAVPGKCYISMDDADAVYVVSNDLRKIVSKRPEEFRDHRIAPVLTTLITRVIIRTTGGEIELEKAQDNWTLLRPIRARANNDVLIDLLNRINQTQIVKFIPREKANGLTTGLDSSSVAVTLFANNDDKVEIQLGGIDQTDENNIFVLLPERNALVTIEKAFAKLFEITPNELRDRKIARIPPDLVDRVTIERADQPKVLLSREEDQWRLIAPENIVANAKSVSHLFEALNSGEITNFVSDTATDLAKYGLEKPLLKFSFSSYASENTAETTAGETVLTTVLFGKSENGQTYGRIADEPFIFSVSDDLVAELPSREFDFRTLAITDLKRPALLNAHIEHLGDPAFDLVRDDKNNWVVKGNENRQNEGEIALFLNTISGLRASQWAGDPKPEYELDKPSLIITLTYLSGETQTAIILRFGAANEEGQHYGTISTIRGVFLLNDSEYKHLNASLAE